MVTCAQLCFSLVLALCMRQEGDHDEDQDYVMIVPPPHVKGNHIYSNAYKHALNNGLSLDDAKERARAATNDFRECGKVRKAWVGTFRARK